MMPIPLRVVAAIGAWAALIAYVSLMFGFFGDVTGLAPTATSAPGLDEGLTNLTALAGTAVVGVIAGLTGVSVANGAGLTSKLGLVLTAGFDPASILSKIAAPVYLFVYVVVAVRGGLLWHDHGSSLTPEFIRTQVLAAAGLVGAMAAVGANK